MFKASLPRHAQLGRVARRQLSTLSPLLPANRASTSKTIARIPRTSLLRSTLIRQPATRCYSSEAAAEAHTDSTQEGSPELVTKFADLAKIGVNDAVVKAITNDMKYEDMTSVQSMTISPAMKGVDLVAQAKTGTGKTLAFLVPILHRILENNPSLGSRPFKKSNSFTRDLPGARDIQAIIISPTRELAEQIGVEARKIAKNTGVIVQTAVGGTQKREALYKCRSEGCHILVATPGRLQDILSDPSTGIAAPGLQTLVLDEADRMLDVGFAEDIRNIQDMLPDKRDVDRQTLLFSATMPSSVIGLAKDMVKRDNFQFIRTFDPNEEQTHDRVPQHIVPTFGYENWLPSVLEIAEKAVEKQKADPLEPPFKAVVFFSQTAVVQFGYSVLTQCPLFRNRDGPEIFEIHSQLTQQQRTRSADRFRRAESAVLISSDVTARGMDFPNVTHVIQVGLPPDREQYIHRVGRTGRAGKNGEGWLVVSGSEIPEARNRLYNLPIKPNKSIEVADVNLESQNIPSSAKKHIDDVATAYSRVDPGLFENVYRVLLGQKFGRGLRIRDVVTLVNNWAFRGLGLSETPLISPKTAANKGLNERDNIRIGHPPRSYENDTGFGRRDRDSFSRGRGNSFDRGFGGRNDRFGNDRRGGSRGSSRGTAPRSSF